MEHISMPKKKKKGGGRQAEAHKVISYQRSLTVSIYYH